MRLLVAFLLIALPIAAGNEFCFWYVRMQPAYTPAAPVSSKIRVWIYVLLVLVIAVCLTAPRGFERALFLAVPAMILAIPAAYVIAWRIGAHAPEDQ